MSQPALCNRWAGTLAQLWWWWPSLARGGDTPRGIVDHETCGTTPHVLRKMKIDVRPARYQIDKQVDTHETRAHREQGRPATDREQEKREAERGRVNTYHFFLARHAKAWAGSDPGEAGR